MEALAEIQRKITAVMGGPNSNQRLSLYSIDPDRWLSVWIATKFIEDCEAKIIKDDLNWINLTNKRKLINLWMDQPNEEARLLCQEAKFLPCPGESAMISCALRLVSDWFHRTNKSILFFAGINAAKALKVKPDVYIEKALTKHLTFIIDYKLKSNQTFGSIEDVFNAASDADKEKLLFHLNQPESKN